MQFWSRWLCFKKTTTSCEFKEGWKRDGKKRKVRAHPLMMQMYNTKGGGGREGWCEEKRGRGGGSSFTLCLYMSLVICKHWAQSLQNMLNMHVRNLCVPWAYGSGTDAFAQCARNWWVSLAYASVSYAYAQHKSKKCQILMGPFKPCWAYAQGTDACASEIKWYLAPPKMRITSLYFSPKVTSPEWLFGVKIMPIQVIKISL